MRTALVQLTSGDDPAENLESARSLVREAAAAGARFVLTPEVTNCVSASRTQQGAVLQREADDLTLAGLSAEAAELGIWLLIGSLALKTEEADGRFANRSILLNPDGAVIARYDKIHMFDVAVSDVETYRESAAYRPGSTAVRAQTPFATLGLTICYDVRFPRLYHSLARAGANVLTVPSAFSPVTGEAHWETLLRARAIETGCWVLAPAQCGAHPASRGRQRRTYGHSLAVSPWGDVVLDGGDDPGVHVFNLDLAAVEDARARIPSLANARDFDDI